jgi:2-dehydro-3-deoxygluconokinase
MIDTTSSEHPALDLRPAADCRYDVVALGEVMLRLDPGEGRIRTARSFRVWEGGGEYNVARGLRRAFGLRGAIVTALADNEVGRLVEDCILTGGLDTELIRWVPYDGIGRDVRNGLNFTERGFGVRGAVGVSDRGHTAVSQLKPGDVDWDHLFGELGVRWLHTGGIFAALSESTAEVVVEAVTAAKRHGTVVSYDLNYRPSLWRSIGGQAKAQEVNRAIAPHVDVMIGNEEDFTASLGFEVEGADADLTHLETAGFARMIETAAAAFPNFRVIGTTLRTVRSATVNDWGALAWSRATGVVEATHRPGLEILDRVGGGDSFASGLIYGLLDGQPLATAVEYGAAHGALAMTTPGDTTMVTKAEVLKLASGGGARVDR